MSGSVVRLKTKPDRLRADQADQLRQMVLSLPGLPERAVGEIVEAIDRTTAAQNGWTFLMLSPDDNDRVADWLFDNSARPKAAVRLWLKLFRFIRRDTCEVMKTREELAELVGVKPDVVSEIMGELEGIGAISRRRVKVAGMRGPGVVRYFMNPTIGTHLTGASRDRAQAEAPELRLVESPR